MRKGTRHKGDYRGTLEQRFWAKVHKANGCWEWTGAKQSHGYGLIRNEGKNLRASRLSYEMHKGQIPEGTFVCHSCDNPPCVNPDHLWLGTNLQNVRDMVFKQRHTLGEKNHQAIMTEKGVREMRKRFESGETQASLAREFGMSAGAVCQIVNRERWKHIQ